MNGKEKTHTTCTTVSVISILSSIAASVLPSCDWQRSYECCFGRCTAQWKCKGPQVAAERVYSSSCLDSTINIWTQIRRNLHRDFQEKRINPSYNRCLGHEGRLGRLVSCFFQACAAHSLSVPKAFSCWTCMAVSHVWCNTRRLSTSTSPQSVAHIENIVSTRGDAEVLQTF